jgi:hypothetical protein
MSDSSWKTLVGDASPVELEDETLTVDTFSRKCTVQGVVFSLWVRRLDDQTDGTKGLRWKKHYGPTHVEFHYQDHGDVLEYYDCYQSYK